MPTAVYTMVLSRELEDEQHRAEGRGRVARRTLVAQLVPLAKARAFLEKTLYCDDCKAMSGTPRPS